ncbi:hypothetical protein GCM10020219_045180 [Nonomuraea dietziae]
MRVGDRPRSAAESGVFSIPTAEVTPGTGIRYIVGVLTSAAPFRPILAQTAVSPQSTMMMALMGYPSSVGNHLAYSGRIAPASRRHSSAGRVVRTSLAHGDLFPASAPVWRPTLRLAPHKPASAIVLMVHQGTHRGKT